MTDNRQTADVPRYDARVRHLIALLVFVVACVVLAFVLGLSDTSLFGYMLLCIVFVFPVCAAIYAYVGSTLSARRWNEGIARARGERTDKLPPGVSWVFPEHMPGNCGSPETPADAQVVD